MTKARDLAELINKIDPEEASRLRAQIAQGYDDLENLNKYRGNLWAEIETLKNKIKQLNNELDYSLLREVVELQNDISHLGMHLDDNPDEMVFQEELDIRLDRYNQLIGERIGRSSITDVGHGEAYDTYVEGTKIWTRMSEVRDEIEKINQKEDKLKYEIQRMERSLPPTPSPASRQQDPDFVPDIPEEWYDEPTEEEWLKADLYAAEENERWQKIFHEREIRLLREQTQREIEEVTQRTVRKMIEQSRTQRETKDIKLDPEFADDLERLLAKGNLVGREIEVYLYGKHPKGYLALRYRISSSKLILKVRNKVPNEINDYDCEFGPDAKLIRLSMCVDKNDHFYARTFKRKEGDLWKKAEKAYGPGSERIRNMTAYDLFQYYDRIEGYIQSEKKGQRN